MELINQVETYLSFPKIMAIDKIAEEYIRAHPGSQKLHEQATRLKLTQVTRIKLNKKGK